MSAVPSRLRAIVDGLVVACLAIASFGAITITALEPRDSAAGVAVVFAPWTGAEASFARAVEAGGRFVRYGIFPFIVVIVPEATDYLSRLRRVGAILVVDPQALDGCLPSGRAAGGQQ